MGTPKTKSTAIICGAARLTIVWLALVLELVRGEPPALYMFGDSELDVGNINYVKNVPAEVKADHPRYGVDYPGGVATGRYSNGRNLADFVADSLGAPSPPAYLSIAKSKENINATGIFLKGVNFVYAGARVREPEKDPHSLPGTLYRPRGNDLAQQIERDYSSVRTQLVRQLGETQASAHLATSIFVIAVGMQHRHSGSGTLLVGPCVPERDRLRSRPRGVRRRVGQHLQRLYDLGMRKVLVVGAGPLGCYPALRRQREQCRDDANSVSARYNSLVRGSLGSRLRYTFLDQYTVLQRYMQEPQANGYADVEAACCVADTQPRAQTVYAPTCNQFSEVCPDRRNHMFWESFHLTEITTQKLAAVAFNGSAPNVLSLNLRALVSARP